MAKGLIGGMTDYDHQSFPDILNDLNEERNRTISFRDGIQKKIKTLTVNSYWSNKVPFNFKNIIAFALRHYNTSITEFDDIIKDLKKEVKEHHIKRLNKIAIVAQDINVKIGKIWHQQYDNKEYGDDDFYKVENIYEDTRDMAVNLLDTSNIAERLKDYLGKTNQNITKNNPWIAGSFYLTVAVFVITGLAVLSKTVHWSLLPLIIISSILIVGLVGILQLKNDDKIADKSFISLMTETFKKLPLIGQRRKK